MGKQIIRLTEEDLHNIISESVKRCLNEISDLTIHSAMNKAWQQANKANDRMDKQVKINQANRFAQSYSDRLNKNHGINIRPKSNTNHEITPYEIAQVMSGMSDYPSSIDDKALRGVKRYYDFNRGKYNYEKGKGWKPNMNKE